MTEISKADMLRFAADYVAQVIVGHEDDGVVASLRHHADRLDRAAADDAELEEAARLAYEAGNPSEIRFGWENLRSSQELWRNVARALRDHFRKPRTDQDAERIGRAVWREAWKLVKFNERGAYMGYSVEYKRFGETVLHAIDGGDQ